MKERAKRFLTSIVAALTLVSSVPAQAYASETETDSSLISPQDNGTTSDAGSGNASVVENNTPDGGGTTDGNTATNVNTTNETTNNVTPTSTTSDTTTNVTPTADTTTGNSTPIDENDLGENDLGGDDLGEADQDDWDMESEDALILSVEASTFSLRTAAAQEPTLLAEEGSSEEGSSEVENQTTPVINIGELGKCPTDTGWNAGSETEKASGWRYDGTSVSMVNNGTAVDVHAEGTGVNFSMAGVNHIGTLYADGDVNITGTGILLIDEIDMLDGTKVNLLTNTSRYTDGSVAVFLLNKTSGEYELINGKGETNVAGILDEEYTIPAGVTLVVPEGGTLDMRVTATGSSSGAANAVSNAGSESAASGSSGVTLGANSSGEGSETTAATAAPTNTENTRTTATNAPYSSPVLNIAASAVLKIQQGAQLLMESFLKTINSFRYYNASTLNVEGTLLLDGSIQATKNTEDGRASNFFLNVKEGGSVQGSGTMTDVYVKYEENAGSDKDTLNIKSSIETASSQTSGSPSYDTSFVSIAGSGKIGSLNAAEAGNTVNVIFADGASIGSISAAEGSDVRLYSRSPYQQMNVGSIAGNYTVDSGYLSVGGSLVTHTFSNPTPAGTNGAIPVEVYLGSILGSGAAPMIPGIEFVDSFKTSAGSWESRGSYSDTISYDALCSTLGSRLPAESGDVLFEVYSVNDGKVTVSLFYKGHSPNVDRNSVFLIRAAKTSIYGTQMGGSSITETNTSNTGSGILGGQNAGSFTGGNSNSVLGGSRPKPTEPKPTEPVTPPTEPVTPPTEPVTPPTEPKPTEAGYFGNISEGNGATSGSNQNLTVKVFQGSSDFRVTAYVDGVELKQLEGGTIPVTMEVAPQDGWNKNDLFVVFRGENGRLIAVKARYNPITGMLMFDAPMLGKFQLVSFPWDGTDYESEAFLAALDDYLN